MDRAIVEIAARRSDPQEPYAKVGVPLKKGPGGLQASVSLEEPRT
jgi:hypothetical protein